MPGLHAGNDSLMEVVREGGLTALLLDVCELALCRVSNPEPSEAPLSQEGSGLGQLQAALGALQAVLALNLTSPPLSLETCCDVMLLLTDVAQVSDGGVATNKAINQLTEQPFISLCT